jgi:hypothetical protein
VPIFDPLNQREQVMSQLLAPGTTALDFTLRVTPDQNLSLGELRGRRVILSFYPADWSPVCGDQITLYNQVRPEFEKYGAEILGISVGGHGVIRLTQSTITFTSRFWRIFIQRVPSRRIRHLSRTGWRVRTGSFRDRPKRGDFLELPVADRRQPGRGRHSRCSANY